MLPWSCSRHLLSLSEIWGTHEATDTPPSVLLACGMIAYFIAGPCAKRHGSSPQATFQTFNVQCKPWPSGSPYARPPERSRDFIKATSYVHRPSGPSQFSGRNLPLWPITAIIATSPPSDPADGVRLLRARKLHSPLPRGCRRHNADSFTLEITR